MTEENFGFSNYEVFNDAISHTKTANEAITSAETEIKGCQSQLGSDAIFMGPIADSCKDEFNKISVQISSMEENFTSIASFLSSTSDTYKGKDNTASNKIINTGIKNESTSKKRIDTKNIKSGTKVSKALTKYKDELEGAEYATVNDKIFTTTKTEMINGQPVKVTHVVINDPSQINGSPANGSYGNGLETSSSAANRLNSAILVNGSHFRSDGQEDLQGANNIVIVNGEIKKDGVSGGQELLLDSDGNIYNAAGKSAQQLVDDGVKYSFACHSTQVIENGDTSPSYNEPRHYMRTVIGQTNPGEYYIVTDTTENNVLSDTAEYLKGKGCDNAYSLDQGGSVTLVRDNNVINTPRDGSEREVGDFLYFTA